MCSSEEAEDGLNIWDDIESSQEASFITLIIIHSGVDMESIRENTVLKCFSGILELAVRKCECLSLWEAVLTLCLLKKSVLKSTSAKLTCSVCRK